MSLAVTALVLAAIPFVIRVSSSSVVTQNGRIVESTYRDWVAIGCGGLALVLGAMAVVAARRGPVPRGIGLAVLAIAAGAFQLARGFGML